MKRCLNINSGSLAGEGVRERVCHALFIKLNNLYVSAIYNTHTHTICMYMYVCIHMYKENQGRIVMAR